MDYDVFGKYVQCGTEKGKPKFLGPRTEGSRPSIAFTLDGDGKPTWWAYDASGGECFYAESDGDLPPRTGWRKQYAEKGLDVTLEGTEAARAAIAAGTGQTKASGSRGRSRSPRRPCPW